MSTNDNQNNGLGDFLIAEIRAAIAARAQLADDTSTPEISDLSSPRSESDLFENFREMNKKTLSGAPGTLSHCLTVLIEGEIDGIPYSERICAYWNNLHGAFCYYNILGDYCPIKYYYCRLSGEYRAHERPLYSGIG